MKTKRNKICYAVLAMAVGLMISLTATAQVFVLGEDNNRQGTDINGEHSNVIYHGSTNDQTNYVPMGSGTLLLAALGGVYLLRKKVNGDD